MPLNKSLKEQNTRIKKIVKRDVTDFAKNYKARTKTTKKMEKHKNHLKQILNELKTSSNIVLIDARASALFNNKKYYDKKNAKVTMKRLNLFLELSIKGYAEKIIKYKEVNLDFDVFLKQQKENTTEFRKQFSNFSRELQKIMIVEEIDPLIDKYSPKIFSLIRKYDLDLN
jgi:uncharacterized HAD superfamily protein